eukprot:1498055-Pyramimonas_sp.AAC.1
MSLGRRNAPQFLARPEQCLRPCASHVPMLLPLLFSLSLSAALNSSAPAPPFILIGGWARARCDWARYRAVPSLAKCLVRIPCRPDM